MTRNIVMVLVLGLFVVGAVIALPAQETAFSQDGGAESESEMTGAPLVIAHQGGNQERPGNTMIAFENAVAVGADVLEMDIHSSSDGVLVVIHDDTVDRTTDGSGLVNDLTFEELQALDAGYHWPLWNEAEIEGHPYRGQGVKIPALAEVLAAFPDMPMTIEIKQKEPSIVDAFCEMLHEYEVTEQVIVASFHAETMVEFRENCPDVATSGVEDEIRNFYVYSRGGRADQFEGEMVAFQVPEYFGSLHIVTEQFVLDAQANGFAVQVWTVNDVEGMERMIGLGVAGIMTDVPSVLVEILGEEEAATATDSMSLTDPVDDAE